MLIGPRNVILLSWKVLEKSLNLLSPRSVWILYSRLFIGWIFLLFFSS